MPTPVNSVLVNRAILHGHYLERYKAATVRKIVVLLNRDVLPDLADQWEIQSRRIEERGWKKMPQIAKRVQASRKAINGLLQGAWEAAGESLIEEFGHLATLESAWQIQTLSKSIPFAVEYVTPNAEYLRAIVESRPFEGKVLSEWWSGIESATQDRIAKAVQIGLAEGQSVPDLARRIRGTKESSYADGLLDVTRRESEAIVRTAASHVSTQAREATFEANKSVIKGEQFIATLDSRTCSACQELDGEVFPVGEGRRPPIHWGCRCTLAAVTKSWAELGIKGLKEMPASTRASMNGQVSDKITYGQWLQDQPEHIQDEALGPTRARLFRDGKVKIDQFTADNGRLLNLKQLAAKEGLSLAEIRKGRESVKV